MLAMTLYLCAFRRQTISQSLVPKSESMLSGDPHQQAINAGLALDFAANLHVNKENIDGRIKLPGRLERGTAVTENVGQSGDQRHEQT